MKKKECNINNIYKYLDKEVKNKEEEEKIKEHIYICPICKKEIKIIKIIKINLQKISINLPSEDKWKKFDKELQESIKLHKNYINYNSLNIFSELKYIFPLAACILITLSILYYFNSSTTFIKNKIYLEEHRNNKNYNLRTYYIIFPKFYHKNIEKEILIPKCNYKEDNKEIVDEIFLPYQWKKRKDYYINNYYKYYLPKPKNNLIKYIMVINNDGR